MRSTALLILFIASCAADPAGRIAEPVSEKLAGACTVLPNDACSGTAEHVPCVELPSDRGLEQLVCCPGVTRFVERLCTGQPNSNSPCGKTGPLGCAVCNKPAPAYDKECAVSAGDDFLTGVYRDTDGVVHHVRFP